MSRLSGGAGGAVVVALLACVVAQWGCQESLTGAPAALTGTTDIVQTAASAGNFNTLSSALATANMVNTLKGKGPFTVFAPTDAAFAKLPEGKLDGLMKDPAQLRNVLNNHIVPGKITADQVTKMTSAKTELGQTLPISTEGGGVMIGGANVIKPDIMASNGVIHGIDQVLLPR
ncbi:MAG: fasciclin domain-containing protein [Phycisphaerae bacterium]|nr:fasciclin domain-containing protein [Phycisphaerae bacterium]